MNVIIFIDALPYDEMKNFEGRIKGRVTRLIPELGYSSNQHVALFAGLLPRECGYLGDFHFFPRKRFSFRQRLSHNHILNFLVRRVLGKLGYNKANIPIGLGSVFENVGNYPLASYRSLCELDSRYSRYEFFEIHDLESIREVNRRLESSNDIFLVFNQVDHAGHIYGTADPRYKAVVDSVWTCVTSILDGLGEGDQFAVISDHGMSNQPKKLELDLERVAGPQGDGKYLYFVDSSICKLWYFNDAIKEVVREYFDQIQAGRLLDSDEREYWGVDDSICDDLFVLDSAFYFEPQYFGYGLRTKTMGMHGSLPTSTDQHGVLITANEAGESMRNVEVFDWLARNKFI